jgi:hypothetical protein
MKVKLKFFISEATQYFHSTQSPVSDFRVSNEQLGQPTKVQRTSLQETATHFKLTALLLEEIILLQNL